jgi:prophage regulatory protein
MPIREVMRRTGYSRPSLYRLAEEGKFPQWLDLGAKTVFVESEVEAYMAEKLAERDRRAAERMALLAERDAHQREGAS